jgi:hypothetical protein
MEQASQIFEPLKTPGGPIALALLCALAAGGLMLWLLLKAKDIERNRRMLLSMLLFFAFLISLFSAAGIAVNAAKFRRVAVTDSAVFIGKKEIPFSNLRGYLIREDRSQSWVNPGVAKKTVRSLVLEEKSGVMHLLPESYYDLPRLINALDEAFK